MWNQNSPSPKAPIALPSTLMLETRKNLLVILLDPLGAAAQLLRRLLAVAEVAEIGRETKLVILDKGLAAEDQHEMPVPGLLDRPNCRGRERPGEVDPFDLGPAGSG